MSRLDQLLEFLKEDPNDPFTLYALAMEYEKSDMDESLKYYENLLQNYENYTGTYYHAARVYHELGRREDAEKTYIKGIELTKKLLKTKDLQELQRAYNAFLYDED